MFTRSKTCSSTRLRNTTSSSNSLRMASHVPRRESGAIDRDAQLIGRRADATNHAGAWSWVAPCRNRRSGIGPGRNRRRHLNYAVSVVAESERTRLERRCDAGAQSSGQPPVVARARLRRADAVGECNRRDRAASRRDKLSTCDVHVRSSVCSWGPAQSDRVCGFSRTVATAFSVCRETRTPCRC